MEAVDPMMPIVSATSLVIDARYARLLRVAGRRSCSKVPSYLFRPTTTNRRLSVDPELGC